MVTQQVSITMTGWKNVQRKLRKIPQTTKVEGKKLTKRLADFIVRSAKQRVGPMKTGTGDLMRSIKWEETTNGYKVTAGKGAVNMNGVNYARFQEYGFRPHFIHLTQVKSGANMKGFRVRTPQTGRFRKQFFYVKRWTPFMGPAYRKALSRLPTELKRTANNIVGGK